MKPKYCLVALCAVLALTSCKLRIVVPEGGSVTTQSGAYRCASGRACNIDVIDFYFNETFIASPKDGYRFRFWRKADRRFCGEQMGPCNLSTLGLNSDIGLADLMVFFFDSDEIFFLEPVFAKSNASGNKIDLNGRWNYSETLGKCTVKGSFEQSVTANTRLCQTYPSPVRQITFDSTAASCKIDTFSSASGHLTACVPIELPGSLVSEKQMNAAWIEYYGTGDLAVISSDRYKAFWESGKVAQYTRVKSGTTASFRRPVKSPHQVTQSYNGKYISDKFHTGVDYISDSNLALATNYGRVVRVQVNGEGCRVGCNTSGCGCKDKGFGNSLIIEHTLSAGGGEKTYSMYAHLSDFDANIYQGVCVSPGTVLGTIGGTGFGSADAWGRHLHFEIKTTNTLTNPSGSGTYFGYTPTNADNFGFIDPYFYIVSPANQTAVACN